MTSANIYFSEETSDNIIEGAAICSPNIITEKAPAQDSVSGFTHDHCINFLMYK